MLLGANSAHAGGSPGPGAPPQQRNVGDVPNIIITTPDITGPPADTVTVPINQAATFKAVSTAGTPAPNAGWTPAATPTYVWTVEPSPPATASPPNTDTTTVSSTYANAGVYSVKATCTVTYQATDGMGNTGICVGSGSKTVTIDVIGGSITGDQDEYFFCSDNLPQGNIDALGYLYAAPNQPAGTTYSWSISGPAIYCDADGNAATPTTASTRFRGTLPGSKDIGDVTANVTYSLNNVSAKSSPDWKITVHVPKTFTITSFTPAAPYAYGFSGQSITFKVIDSVKQPYPPGKAYWSESWTQAGDGGHGQPTNTGGGPLDNNSQSTDGFSSPTGLNAPSDPNDAFGDLIWGPLTHIYAITHTGGTGGLIGCPIQTYTNVNYYTYQITGNGFAQK